MVTNVSGWVAHFGIFLRLGGNAVSVKLVTWSSLLHCIVRRPGTRHLRHFDNSGFTPILEVEVGLDCVRADVLCPALDGPG